MNNQSGKPEIFEPKDSERKEVHHPQDDNNAVVNPEDEKYKKEDANFKNPAKSRENSEQPVRVDNSSKKDN